MTVLCSSANILKETAAFAPDRGFRN